MARSAGFSFFKGRLGRRDYWIFIGLLMGFKIGATIATSVIPALAEFLRNTDVIMFFVAGTVGKRMRDFGWSAIWGVAAIALVVLVIPGILASHGEIYAAPTTNLKFGVKPAVFWITTFPLLVLLIAVGIKKGDAGTNKYGPSVDMLGRPQPATAVSRVFD